MLRGATLVAACGVVFVAGPAAAAPVLAGGTVSPVGWWAGTTLGVSWTQSEMEGSGATSVAVEMNQAGDGTATGGWETVWSENGSTSGPRAAVIPTQSREGKRAVRVVVRAGSQVVAAMALGPAHIDHTPPVLSRPGAIYSPAKNVFSWAEEDVHSGLDAAVGHSVEVNSNAHGSGGGLWVPATFVPSGQGAQSVTVPANTLSPGTHLVRARAVDRAGNETRFPVGVAFNDQTPPTVSNVRVVDAPTGPNQSVEVEYGFADAAPGSGFESAVPTSLATESGATLWEGAQSAGGSARIRAHLPGPRTYRLVVRVTDRAGNTGVSAPITVVSPARGVPGAIGPDGAGSPSLRDVANPDLRLRLALVGARRRGGAWVTRIVYGQSVTLRGALTNAAGRAARREELEVRDPSGRMLGRVDTDGAGRFQVTVAPHTGGDLRVGVPLGGGRLAIPVTAVPARILVRPRVSLNASTTAAVAGGSPLVFTGRVAPGPGTLKGTARKRVVLEWLDPLRREWRPVLNGYADARGRYRFSWRFGVPGFSIPMRVNVPPELGWPFEPALSRVVTVVVR